MFNAFFPDYRPTDYICQADGIVVFIGFDEDDIPVFEIVQKRGSVRNEVLVYDGPDGGGAFLASEIIIFVKTSRIEWNGILSVSWW